LAFVGTLWNLRIPKEIGNSLSPSEEGLCSMKVGNEREPYSRDGFKLRVTWPFPPSPQHWLEWPSREEAAMKTRMGCALLFVADSSEQRTMRTSVMALPFIGTALLVLMG
jgi:hypothetical protein